ncbi:MAG: protein kinase [Gemmatimonas sp.]
MNSDSGTAQRLRTALSDRYRIVRELGAGGMATVFLAHDLKHERDVAIKVLHPDLGAALGAERFLSEIKTTAKLQHPHVLPLLDSGAADGLLYYVMPFVTGETLRDRLTREQQLPIGDAVSIASEVADALGYAHGQRIIHRDIKPENILLQGGHALVADFGIALAVQQAGGARMTQTGLSLGTPQYMSPEQAMGERTIDARSDVYALGAVTYEMLTGEAPFTGVSVQAIVAKVLTERPTRPTSVRDTVPRHVESAVLTALAKLPADRQATVNEFAAQLKGASAIEHHAKATGTAQRESTSRRTIGALAAVAVLSTLVAAWALLRNNTRVGSPPVVTRGMVLLPDSANVISVRPPVISHDGRTIAILGTSSDGTRPVYVRATDGVDFRLALVTDGRSRAIALAPDGSGIVLVGIGDSVLLSSPIGSPPVLLARIGTALLRNSAYWGMDGHILIASDRALLRIPASGGRADTLFALSADRPTGSIATPRLLPDGKAVLFSAGSVRGADLEVRALDLASRKVQTVVKGRDAHVVEPGMLVYNIGQDVVAQAFDARSRTVSGPVVTLAGEPLTRDVSSNGVAIFSDRRAAAGRLYSVGGSGTPSVLSVPGGVIRGVQLDRAGRRVVYGVTTGDQARIFVADLNLGANTMILPNDWRGYDPFWSADERSITFTSRARDSASRWTLGFDGFEMAADGSGSPRQLFRDSMVVAPQGWLADGKLLARGSMRGEAANSSDLFVLTMRGDSSSAVPWLRADWDERSATPSPDGRFIAYVSTESGHDEVTVRPYPDASAGKWIVSEGTASDPVWARDGKTLFYWEGDVLRAARLRTSPSFAVLSRETVRTDADYQRSCCFPNYDVAPDGKRVILARFESASRVRGLMLVSNWGEEIRAKLAAAGRK